MAAPHYFSLARNRTPATAERLNRLLAMCLETGRYLALTKRGEDDARA